jgi:hypothetical protein
MFVNFTAIWNIIWRFGILYDQLVCTFFIDLVHFFRFWYHVPRKIWQPWSVDWDKSFTFRRRLDSPIVLFINIIKLWFEFFVTHFRQKKFSPFLPANQVRGRFHEAFELVTNYRCTCKLCPMMRSVQALAETNWPVLSISSFKSFNSVSNFVLFEA